MIDLHQIKNYFPAELRETAALQKYMLKEYVQLLVLDFPSTSAYMRQIVFIGGTNLRLVKGIIFCKSHVGAVADGVLQVFVVGVERAGEFGAVYGFVKENVVAV